MVLLALMMLIWAAVGMQAFEAKHPRQSQNDGIRMSPQPGGSMFD
jgi:hypothetical protein